MVWAGELQFLSWVCFRVAERQDINVEGTSQRLSGPSPPQLTAAVPFLAHFMDNRELARQCLQVSLLQLHVSLA